MLLQIHTCLGSARARVILRSPAERQPGKGTKVCRCCKYFCGCDADNLSSSAACATRQPANWGSGGAGRPSAATQAVQSRCRRLGAVTAVVPQQDLPCGGSSRSQSPRGCSRSPLPSRVSWGCSQLQSAQSQPPSSLLQLRALHCGLGSVPEHLCCRGGKFWQTAR